MTEKEWNSFWNSYEEPYIKDGIDINHLDNYLVQKPRVLFILKESNESENIKSNNKLSEGSKSLFDESGWFTSYAAGNRANSKLITKMVKMYKYISEGDTEKHVKDFSASSEDIYNFAFININKHGNGREQTDSKKLNETFEKDKDRLKKQIELLDPDVIVSGVKGIDIESIINPDIIFIRTRHFSRMSYKEFEKEYGKRNS